MKDKQLLSVMFSDATDFREELLKETLGQVRRKRRMRHAGQALLVLAIALFTIWSTAPRARNPAIPSAASGLSVVRTAPLSRHQIVTTRQESVTMISSDKSSVALLGDDQLLEIVPGETKLLVWHAPQEAELVVIGP